MANIRKRNGKWQAQIRRASQPSFSKSFMQKSDAERWSRMIESKLDVEGLLPDTNILKCHTLGDLITRYLEQVTAPHPDLLVAVGDGNRVIIRPVTHQGPGIGSRAHLVTSIERRRWQRHERLKVMLEALAYP